MSNNRILVIDDDYSLLRLVQIILGKSGFSVVPVLSSVEGRNQLLNKGLFNLIVLDLMMPQESGFDFLKWKELQDDIIRNIPVIVVTAKNLNDDEIAYLSARSRKIISKGMNYTESISREVSAHFK